MKISFLLDLQSKLKNSTTEEDFYKSIEYIKSLGININNLYQELEMSSSYANIHKDVSYKKSNISVHSHSFYEIIFCRSADRVKYFVGSKQYKLVPGDIIVVAPGVSHRPILPDDMQYPYERDILWVNPDFMKQVSELFESAKADIIKNVLLLRTKGTSWGYIGDYFADGVKETMGQKEGHDKIVTAHAILIISHILRAAYEMGEQNFVPEKPTMINSLVEYVEKHLDEKLSLDEVASHFYISRGTVNKLFRQSMDSTFYKFLTQRRLIMAKSLIKEGHSMEEISVRCGFSDYSTFFKSFKKEYGISPREFAKIHEKDNLYLQ